MWHHFRETYLLVVLILWRLGIPWLRAAHLVPKFVDQYTENPDQPVNWPKKEIVTLASLVGVVSVYSLRSGLWRKRLVT